MIKARNNPIGSKQVEYYRKALEEGIMPDGQNPVAMLQIFSAELLLKIASGQLDMKPFAIHELKGMGLGRKGEWVGFSQAEVVWEKTKHVGTKSSKHLGMLF